MVQIELYILLVTVSVEVVDTVSVKQAGASLDAVDNVIFTEKKLREVRAVLTCYAGDECGFFYHSILCPWRFRKSLN